MNFLLNTLAAITGDDKPEDANAQMIVHDMEYTRSQRLQLQELNVSAGIPFALNALGGVRRAKGKEVDLDLVGSSEVVSISPKTFMLKAVGPREGKLTFLYTAEREAVVKVFSSLGGAEAFPVPVGHKALFDERVMIDKNTAEVMVMVTLVDSTTDRIIYFKMDEGVIGHQAVRMGGKELVLLNLFGNDDDEEDESGMCVICLENPCNTAVLPCRHQTLCDECTASLLARDSKCPICRKGCQLFVRLVK